MVNLNLAYEEFQEVLNDLPKDTSVKGLFGVTGENHTERVLHNISVAMKHFGMLFDDDAFVGDDVTLTHLLLFNMSAKRTRLIAYTLYALDESDYRISKLVTVYLPHNTVKDLIETVQKLQSTHFKQRVSVKSSLDYVTIFNHQSNMLRHSIKDFQATYFRDANECEFGLVDDVTGEVYC